MTSNEVRDIILGYALAKNKFRYCVSHGVARGRLKNLHMSQQTETIIDDAGLYSYGAWVTYPLISYDYMKTKKYHLHHSLLT